MISAFCKQLSKYLYAATSNHHVTFVFSAKSIHTYLIYVPTSLEDTDGLYSLFKREFPVRKTNLKRLSVQPEEQFWKFEHIAEAV